MQALLKHRSYLRPLSRAQRRKWFEQWKHAKPRVKISAAWLPPEVRKSFLYVELNSLSV